MSFEDSILDRIDRNREDVPPILEEAFQKADSVVRDAEINPRDFVDLYDEQKVEEDLDKVKRAEESFERNNYVDKVAEIFEAIILQEAELSNWLGSNSETIKTSRFDDVFNGSDIVVEFDDEERAIAQLALAVDVTFTSKGMSKNFERILKEIKQGKLGEIKYYKSENHGFKGSLSNVPRVVVGLERDNVLELAELWLKGKKKEMAEHPVQSILIEEIYEQLRTFMNYAERNGYDSVVSSYRKALRIIEEIREMKRDMEAGELENDRVLAEIRQNLKLFE